MVLDKDEASKSYLNLQLSFRGSERQAPSVLTLAVTFSHVMESKSKSGEHSADLNTEARLELVLNEFNSMPGMVSRWRIDDDKRKACLNLIVGTSKAARDQIQSHLHYHKWAHSAFTAEMLRSTRWLLGAVPKAAKDKMKAMLTVTSRDQEAFLHNYISSFSIAAKKVKMSSRSKLRLSIAEWDKLMDYTCVMRAVMDEVQAVLESDEAKQRVLDQLETAYMDRQESDQNLTLNFRICDLSIMLLWIFVVLVVVFCASPGQGLLPRDSCLFGGLLAQLEYQTPQPVEWACRASYACCWSNGAGSWSYGRGDSSSAFPGNCEQDCVSWTRYWKFLLGTGSAFKFFGRISWQLGMAGITIWGLMN